MEKLRRSHDHEIPARRDGRASGKIVVDPAANLPSRERREPAAFVVEFDVFRVRLIRDRIGHDLVDHDIGIRRHTVRRIARIGDGRNPFRRGLDRLPGRRGLHGRGINCLQRWASRDPFEFGGAEDVVVRVDEVERHIAAAIGREIHGPTRVSTRGHRSGERHLVGESRQRRDEKSGDALRRTGEILHLDPIDAPVHAEMRLAQPHRNAARCDAAICESRCRIRKKKPRGGTRGIAPE